MRPGDLFDPRAGDNQVEVRRLAVPWLRLDALGMHLDSLEPPSDRRQTECGVHVVERDEEKFHAYGQQLLKGVSNSIRGWLTITISDRLGETTFDRDLEQELEKVACEVERSISILVNADVDDPLSGPLERIRRAVAPLNDALDERGARRPARDPVEAAMRPEDRHSLGPMTFRDLGDDVHEAGIAWGAAKAHLHLQRRRRPDTP